MKRILIVNSFDVSGGSTIRMRRMFYIIKDLGYEVMYIEANSDLNLSNVYSVAQKNNILGFFLGTLKRCILLLKLKNKYDVLLTQKLTPFTVPLFIVAKLLRKKLIVDFDDWDSLLQDNLVFRYLFSLCENLSFKFPDMYIVATEMLKKVIFKKVRNKKKIYVFPQGIDISVFQPKRYNKNEIKESLGFKQEEKIIGFLGCFTPAGIGEFEKILKSMQYVFEKNRKIKFLVIGGGRLLEKYKVSYADNQNIVFLGSVPHNEVARYISICDLMVIWMRDKVIGDYYKGTLKIIEYLAMGKPVVGYLVGDTLRKFSKFCIISENDIKDFAEKCLWAVRNVTFNENAYKFISENYSFYSGTKTLEDMLKEI